MSVLKVAIGAIFFVISLHSLEASVVELNDENFDTVLDGSTSVFVKFYVPWCGHCKNLAPAWNQLAEDFKNERGVVIAKVNVEACPKLKARFNLDRFPLLKLFKHDSIDQPISYEARERTAEALADFIRQKCDLPKAGSNDETFGTFKGLSDALKGFACETGLAAKECLQTLSQSVTRFIQEKSTDAQTSASKFKLRCSEYYSTFFTKLANDPSYASKEMVSSACFLNLDPQNRLGQLLNNTDITAEAQNFIVARKNILKQMLAIIKDKIPALFTAKEEL